MEKQALTFKIYPKGKPPKECRFDCWVFGVWAVHRPHPDEGAQRDWIVSHAPTGVSAFESGSFVVAVQAAKKLMAIEPPAVKVVEEPGDMPHVVPLPIEWIEMCAESLIGMDIFCRAGDRLVSPEWIVLYTRQLRARQGIAT